MAHANQERWSRLVDEKLRNTLVTRDNLVFNNRYEGNPKAGKVKIPVRDTEVEVKNYNKASGIDPAAGTTTYLDLAIDHDEAVNELIDGSRAERVQWTKQRRRGWRSAPIFASGFHPAPRKSAKRKRHERRPLPVAETGSREWRSRPNFQAGAVPRRKFGQRQEGEPCGTTHLSACRMHRAAF